ncbi:MAG: monovalent cation/H+ antiporter subunit D [Bauldia sp.]|nr:monovalent cation/H+ antiporter subunit D [Bauldia sp.]
MTLADHLAVLPILVPLAVAALTLLLDERRRRLKLALSIGTSVVLIAVAATLLVKAGASGAVAATYPLGNWPIPFGIVLVADRLSAIMVLVTAILTLFALIFASARWARAGVSFHTLVLVLLTGLNGAFLTGDLFNLFVFFEVLLAASYGLVLHGSGATRIRAGLHYVAINLAASSLFLIGVALIYGVTGTLSMADLAARIPAVAAEDRGLLNAGIAILGVAFLVKAGMWPLNLWIPGTYSAASAPVAAMFAIMTKVGIYAVYRLSLLALGPDGGASAGFGQTFLLVGGMLTIVFGSVGVLASHATPRLAGFAVTVSSGTLLAAAGVGTPAVTAGALFYLVVSTLTIGAFFLLAELVERARGGEEDVLAATAEPFDEDDEDGGPDSSAEAGLVIPATTAILGSAFAICAMLFAGLPPLSGFLAKFSMLSAMIGTEAPSAITAPTWTLVGILVVSSFAVLIAMVRTGISIFWVTMKDVQVKVRLVEIAPVTALLAIGVGLSVFGGEVQAYMEDTAAALHAPWGMIDAVLGAPVVGGGSVSP